MASGLLADAAIVAVPDAITGSALACACVPIVPIDDPAKLVHHLASAVADSFGASYRPKQSSSCRSCRGRVIKSSCVEFFVACLPVRRLEI